MYRFTRAAAVAAVIAANGLLSPIAAQAETGVSVSFSYFQSNLSPHGRWFSHPRYGRSWRPHGVAAGWRPYTNGRWEWTEEYGWTWASYYDWGWAPFHYGRWVYDPQNRWYWVPGYEWAPAWVAWRHGDGFIGWYPLPPEAVWRPGVGIVYSGTGIYGASYNPRWVFVPERHFLSIRISSVLVRTQDHARFIGKTRRSTNYGWVNNRVVNRGIDRRYIGRVTGKRVVAIKPRVVTGRSDWRRPTPGSRDVRIFRPPVVERRSGVKPGARGGAAAVPKGKDAPGRDGRAAPAPRGKSASVPKGGAAPGRNGRAAPAPRGKSATVPKGKGAPGSNGTAAPGPARGAVPAPRGKSATVPKGKDAPGSNGTAAPGPARGAVPAPRGKSASVPKVRAAPGPDRRAVPGPKGGAPSVAKGRAAPVQKGGAAAGPNGGADTRSRGDTEGRSGPNDGGATMQRGGGGGRRGER